MARPMGAARQALLNACHSAGRASAFDAASSSGFTVGQMRNAASNARRAGQIERAGTQSRAGADRPAIVWQTAQRDALPLSGAWHERLGHWMR